jgi:predicted nucleotidyltransferase
VDNPAIGSAVPRSHIIETLHATYAAMPDALAAFLGGSDASGRTDALSDIDLVVIVTDGAVETALAVAHEALESLSPIAHRWRVPEPTWHGHAQEFLALADADPAHFVDLLVIRATADERLLEPERHGRPLVLFDRGGLVHADPLDRAALQNRIDTRLATLRERFPLFQTLVSRAVRRGFAAEAAGAYQDLTLKPLIELLRIRHCPDRFDFGARYLDRDLPPGLRSEVESLALPGTLAEVEQFRSRAQALFEAVLGELDDPGMALPRDGT